MERAAPLRASRGSGKVHVKAWRARPFGKEENEWQEIETPVRRYWRGRSVQDLGRISGPAHKGFSSPTLSKQGQAAREVERLPSVRDCSQL